MKFTHFVAKFHCNEPANAALIQQFEKENEIILPKEYADFLCFANGGEGFIGDGAYIILWKLEDLIKLNLAYQVTKYANGLFLFGSDGGGEAFAFDLRVPTKPIISVPFIGMSLNDVRAIANTFALFLDKMALTTN